MHLFCVCLEFWNEGRLAPSLRPKDGYQRWAHLIKRKVFFSLPHERGSPPIFIKSWRLEIHLDERSSNSWVTDLSKLLYSFKWRKKGAYYVYKGRVPFVALFLNNWRSYVAPTDPRHSYLSSSHRDESPRPMMKIGELPFKLTILNLDV